MLKRFSVTKKPSPVKIGPQMAVFRQFKGLNIKYGQEDPEKPLLTRSDVIWRILRKNPFRGVGCSLIEKKPNVETVTSKAWHFGGAETLKPIATKFCMSSAVHNLITHANFGEDRLRSFGVARGRILAFSIDLLRHLDNTRTTVRM